MPAARHREWTDRYTLLCERCGYVLEGLPRGAEDAACPECGRPIAESLPERRVGTPWQRGPSPVSLVKTWFLVLFRPRRAIEILRFDQHDPAKASLFALSSILLSGPLMPLFLVLNLIEAFGLRGFARVRGGRFDFGMGWVIVCHGSAGWLISVLGPVIFLASVVCAGDALGHMLYGDAEGREGQTITLLLLGVLFGGLLLIGGFLVFELFAYLGLRRCKYANRVRPPIRSAHE